MTGFQDKRINRFDQRLLGAYIQFAAVIPFGRLNDEWPDPRLVDLDSGFVGVLDLDSGRS